MFNHTRKEFYLRQFYRATRAVHRRLMPLLFPIDYPRIRLPSGLVEAVVRSSGADEWHIGAFANYRNRAEAHRAMQWIARNIPRTARIFETACGGGANLIWLAQRGFTNLAGADIDDAAVDAGRRLARHAHLPILLKVDDCVRSSSPPGSDVIIAISWVYLRNVEFELSSFLALQRVSLRPGGCIVMDMVDSAFNEVPLNQERTDDWHLPPEQRRPTQYKLRMSESDVRWLAQGEGFEVVATIPGSQMPPRRVYVLKKTDRGAR